jgi:hypothetical protein
MAEASPGPWHLGVMIAVIGRLQAVSAPASALAHPYSAHLVALGGGGLGGLLVKLLIWHELFRLFRVLWHIHTFGPIIVIALVAALIALSVWRPWRRGGPWRWRRPGGGWGAGTSSGPGPRDW